jgi:hypothetical protein
MVASGFRNDAAIVPRPSIARQALLGWTGTRTFLCLDPQLRSRSLHWSGRLRSIVEGKSPSPPDFHHPSAESLDHTQSIGYE